MLVGQEPDVHTCAVGGPVGKESAIVYGVLKALEMPLVLLRKAWGQLGSHSLG
jgi:hypothetical protein